MTIIWIVIFLVSLALLIKGADWLLVSAERFGLAVGMSPFVIGVIILGFGTSMPELVTHVVAVFQNVTEIVTANAVGASIANIFFITGIASIIGGTLIAKKDLVELDLPLLAGITALFSFVAWDGVITPIESAILLIAFIIYLAFSLKFQPKDLFKKAVTSDIKKEPFSITDIALMLIGIATLTLGANYLIESVIHLAAIWNIGEGVIAISVLSIGTTLPELVVSVKAVRRGNTDVAFGNIVGSNIFNLLISVGLPGLFTTIIVDHDTLTIGLPILGIATLLFILSSLSRKIYMWEGAIYLVFYVVFIGKLFHLF